MLLSDRSLAPPLGERFSFHLLRALFIGVLLVAGVLSLAMAAIIRCYYSREGAPDLPKLHLPAE